IREDDIKIQSNGVYPFTIFVFVTCTLNFFMSSTETATFGTGCFWCTEAIYKELNGVISVMPGYSGGHTVNPTYKEVCSGETGHAECTQIVYDPSKISYDDLLEDLYKPHDP